MIWIYLQILWKTANGQEAAVLQDSQPSKADFRWKKKAGKYTVFPTLTFIKPLSFHRLEEIPNQLSHIYSLVRIFLIVSNWTLSTENLSDHLYIHACHVWMYMRGSVPNHGTEHQCHVLEMLFPNCGLWEVWTHFSLYLSLRDIIPLTSKAMFSFYVTYMFSLSCSFSANFCINSLVLFHSGSGKYLKEFLLTSWLLYAKI